MTTRILTFLTGILLSSSLYSNHIAGGDFTVRHIEDNTFEAKLVLYRDCEGNLVTDATINISVYDALTDQYLADLSYTMSDPIAEIIPLANSCYDTGLCVESQTYTQTFTLPDNPNGYYMSWERCCRNILGINVITADRGMVFTVSVPDPALENSTPEFAAYPSDGFFCVNGPNAISFGATDIDGDSLVYSLTDPLKGDATSPFGPTTAISGPRPYSLIDWNAGYSVTNQIGGATVMTIDSETGLIQGQPENVGFYTVAVLVEEYRDGVKIGEIRREAQISGTVCIIDNPSEILTPDDVIVFNVLANTEFCIEITVTDPNEGDTLFVQAGGELFDGTVEPMANFPDANGFSTIIQDFCWSPVCENVSDEPYAVTFTAYSRGCANEILVTTKDIFINVILEDNVPTELTGPVLEDEPGTIIDLYDPSTHCFSFVFEDPNEADSMYITATSPIFDLPNAPAIENSFDQGVLTYPYCWDVTCADVRDEPYFIDFTVYTFNCEVQDTAYFTVPIYVVVPENLPTTFIQPQPSYTWTFYDADTFCLPVTVIDENFFDTLNVTATSLQIFDLENPAVLDTLNGTSFVNGQLCWVPRCEDVRPEPYTVFLRATSNSCKTNDEEYFEVDIYLELPPESPPYFELPAPGTFIEHNVGEELIDIFVLARDIDPYDTLTINAISDAFDAPGIDATFEPFTNPGTVVSNFYWGPDCPNINNEEPYVVTFEVTSRSCQKVVTRTLDVQILVTTPTKGKIEPIQNVFTPNADRFNDDWTIENKDDACLLMFKSTVYDRWGKEVFLSNDPAFKWDGQYENGNKAEPGAYFRTIEYFYKDDVKNYSGNLQILD